MAGPYRQLNPDKLTVISIQDIEAIGCAYPDLALLIFDDAPDIVCAQARAVASPVLQNLEGIAIRAVQAFFRSKPHKSLAILEKTTHGVL